MQAINACAGREHPLLPWSPTQTPISSHKQNNAPHPYPGSGAEPVARLQEGQEVGEERGQRAVLPRAPHLEVCGQDGLCQAAPAAGQAHDEDGGGVLRAPGTPDQGPPCSLLQARASRLASKHRGERLRGGGGGGRLGAEGM